MRAASESLALLSWARCCRRNRPLRRGDEGPPPQGKRLAKLRMRTCVRLCFRLDFSPGRRPEEARTACPAPMPRLRISPLHLFVALLLAATGASSTEASFRGARNGGLTGLAFYPLNPPVLPIAKTDLLYPCSATNTFLATDWFSSFLSPPQALLMLIRITNATTGNGNTMVFAVNGAAIYTAQVISSLTVTSPPPPSGLRATEIPPSSVRRYQQLRRWCSFTSPVGTAFRFLHRSAPVRLWPTSPFKCVRACTVVACMR